jgi:serine/threonine-protein kinase
MTTARALGLSVMLAACAWPASARGQSRSRAEQLFDEGKQLRTEGRMREACTKFAESMQLERAVGVTLHLADCYERIGRAASAWVEYMEAEALARARGDARAAVAERRARALEPKLGRVMGALGQVARMLHARIKLDEPSSLPPFDEQPASDAEVTASPPAPSAPPPTAAPAPAAAPAPPVASTGPTAPAGANHPSSATPRPSSTAPSDPAAVHRALALGLAGAGVLGVGIGAGFLVVKNQSMTTGAVVGSPQQDDGAARVSAIAFAAGGAAFVSAVVLYLTAPHPKDASLVLTPAPLAGGAGAFVRTTF